MSPVAWILGPCLLPVLLAVEPDGRTERKPESRILSMRTGDTHLDHDRVSMGRVDRFLELTRASTSGRFRTIERAGVSGASSEIQAQAALLGRVPIDRGGKFAVGLGAFTGNGFTGGWRGVAPRGGGGGFYLKQLHLDGEPFPDLTFQVGGIDIAHGESTEVTSYDYDGYLMGERLRFARANRLFDTLTLTVAHLGDYDLPSVFDRFGTLSDPNYTQILWTKSFAGRVRVSADYTSTRGAPGEDTWRQALRVDLRARRLVETLHFENYQRAGPDPGYGFGLYAERRLGRVAVAGLGYAQIDRSGLNSDRFPEGKRLYGALHLPFGRELSLTAFLSQALGEAELPSLRRRFDLALSYNVLGRLPLHTNR